MSNCIFSSIGCPIHTINFSLSGKCRFVTSWRGAILPSSVVPLLVTSHQQQQQNISNRRIVQVSLKFDIIRNTAIVSWVQVHYHVFYVVPDRIEWEELEQVSNNRDIIAFRGGGTPGSCCCTLKRISWSYGIIPVLLFMRSAFVIVAEADTE